jgi:hypothetical protein
VGGGGGGGGGWGRELAEVAQMTADTLLNLASNPANRTCMYKAELQLKTAVNRSHLAKAAAAAAVAASPRGVREEVRAADAESAARDEAEAEAEAEARGSGDGNGLTRKERHVRLKQSYSDWLSDMQTQDAEEMQELAAAERELQAEVC